MIEDAERSSDADNPEHRQRGIEQVADVTPQEDFEDLGVNAGGQENARRERHSDEELDLVMQPSAIVQETHGGDQSSAGHDASALRASCAVEREQNRQHHAAVHGEAAE